MSKIKVKWGKFMNCKDIQRPYGLTFEILYQDMNHKQGVIFNAVNGFSVITTHYPFLIDKDIYLISKTCPDNRQSKKVKESNMCVGLLFETYEIREKYINDVNTALCEWAK